MKKYRLEGIDGQLYYMTPEEILRCVMSPIDDYGNWLITATECINVCSQPGFPTEVAGNIYSCILYREISIWEDYRFGIDRYDYIYRDDPLTELYIIEQCYTFLEKRHLYSDLREKYLKSIIEGVAIKLCQTLNYPRPIFENWKKPWLDQCSREISSNIATSIKQGKVGWIILLAEMIEESFETALMNARQNQYIAERKHYMLRSFDRFAPPSAFGKRPNIDDYDRSDFDWLFGNFFGY